jgi:hypothetical protein
VQEGDGDAGGVEFAVDLGDEGGADAGAAEVGADAAEAQVGGGTGRGAVGDPVGVRGQVDGDDGDGAAGELGEPDARVVPVEQLGHVLAEAGLGGGSLGEETELGVVANDFQT